MSATFSLSVKHREELAASGLNDETIRLAGIYTENRPDIFCMEILGRSPSSKFRKCPPAIIYPYFDRTGAKLRFCQAKPDNPMKRDGELTKYESPLGEALRVYFPPRTREKLAAGDVAEVLFTEGCKKALRLDQERFAVTGLTGVDGGLGKGSRGLHSDLIFQKWKGVAVYIVFDSDAAQNENVKLAEFRLAQALEGEGATVKIVRLPGGEKNAEGVAAKVGIDDYLQSHTLVDFRALMNEAQPAQRPDAEVERTRAKDLDPVTTARRFVEEKFTFSGTNGQTSRLRHYRGEYLEWVKSAGKWIRLSDDAVRSRLVNWLDPFACDVTQQATANFMGSLKALSFVSDRIDMPRWLIPDDTPPFPANQILPTRSALIHLPSLIAGKAEYSIPPTAFYFSANCLPFDFDPAAPEPVEWLKFLRQLWGDDDQSIGCLQEWFGYLLSGDLAQQKILMLLGPRRSGKGTICRVLRGLAGNENVAGPTLGSLGMNFGLWPLLDKPVAIISDARLSHRTDSAIVTERLLSISGEDSLTVDRKNLRPVTLKLPCRFVICTNELPRLGDSSGALVGRLIVLSLTESFYGREDHALTDRLLSELPGILRWSIEGWKRLSARGYFVQPKAAAGMVDELENLSSPVGQFVRQCCIVKADEKVSKTDLYEAYSKWCEANGNNRSEANVFGRDMRAAVASIGDKQETVLGVRVRYYVGIRIRTPDDDKAETVSAQAARDAQAFSYSTCSEEVESVVGGGETGSNKRNTTEPVHPVQPVHQPGYSSNGHSPLPNDVHHRSAACTSRAWWQNYDHEHYCVECWPCRDRAALIAEGVLS